MSEIIVALIGAGATIGTGIIGVAGVRRSRSRAIENTTSDVLPIEGVPDASSEGDSAPSGRTQSSASDGVTINANNARQVIGRNDGDVTQVNHYGSKRKW